MSIPKTNMFAFCWQSRLKLAAMRLALVVVFGATACVTTVPSDRSLAATAVIPENPTQEAPTQEAMVASTVEVVEKTEEIAATWWQPPVNTTWQWQLGDNEIDQSFDVDMYDIDLFDQSADVVDALHAQGRKVVCYMSVGSYEDWRDDASQFPPSVLGNDYEGWPGEKWLDIRQIDLLAPIMRARLDLCKSKGFDAVEPDNMDSYTNETGFEISYEDQLAYNLWLAEEAHQRGLSIGLKNNAEQVADLINHYDWALTEDCFDQGWCEEMLPFIQAGKPVFAAEYTDTDITLDDFCPQAKIMRISAILKDRDLTEERQACPHETSQAMIFVPAIMHQPE